MPDSDALIPAEGGKLVTITIAEKPETATSDPSDPSVAAVEANTFIIDNGKKILTITIAE